MENNSVNWVKEGEALVAIDELPSKVRKPYTITKQREKWTVEEHQKFLEALKLYGRAWRHIEAHIGTKSAVQIRSHAQKFFSKLEKEASTGILAMIDQDLKIPPPRPKRKPGHPYPRKAGVLIRAGDLLIAEEETHIESCEVSTISTGSRTGHSETAEFPQHASNSKPLIKQKMMQGLSQPSRIPMSLKLFGQTLLVQQSSTDDTLWPPEKRTLCSKALSKNHGGIFQSAPCREEISYCQKIINERFSAEASDIDTFQSGDSSTGRDSTHKSSDVANEGCSHLLPNSGHSASSKEDEIGSTTHIKRFSRNYDEQNDNLQHWKKSQDYTKKHKYFQQSHDEDERHKSEILLF